VAGEIAGVGSARCVSIKCTVVRLLSICPFAGPFTDQMPKASPLPRSLMSRRFWWTLYDYPASNVFISLSKIVDRWCPVVRIISKNTNSAGFLFS
jgi:hypothetical protein